MTEFGLAWILLRAGHTSSINAGPYIQEEKIGHAIDCDMCGVMTPTAKTPSFCSEEREEWEGKAHFELYQMHPDFHLNSEAAKFKYNLHFLVKAPQSDYQTRTANHCILAQQSYNLVFVALNMLCSQCAVVYIYVLCTKVCLRCLHSHLSSAYQPGQLSTMQPSLHNPPLTWSSCGSSF